VHSSLPAELVGVWDGGDGRGPLTFTADGRFRTNTSAGIVSVQGRNMTMTIEGQHPRTTRWSLDKGILTLGNATYLRDDEESDNDPPLTGLWISVNGFVDIQFESDGSFKIDDPANKKHTAGRYTLHGSTLTLTSSTGGTIEYLVTFGTFLTFSRPDGTVIGEYARAG
jgi:hypothetical protein